MFLKSKRFGSRDIKFKLGDWLVEWLSTRFLSMGYSSAMEAARDEIWHIGSLGDVHDVRTSNTLIAQRKRAISYHTRRWKNNRNIIECCNNTRQGAPHTDKQMCACASDFADASHVTSIFGQLKYMLFEYRQLWIYANIHLSICSICSVCVDQTTLVKF